MSSTMTGRPSSGSATAPNLGATGSSIVTTPPASSTEGSAGATSPLSGLPVREIPRTSQATVPVTADGTQLPPTAAATAATASDRGPIVPAGSEALPVTGREAAFARGAREGAMTAAPSGAESAIVLSPPPAPRTEATPSTTGSGDRVWVPGHYTWSGTQWTWVSGAHQRPPSAGATWVPGNYNASTRQWTPGHWSSGTERQ